jgi:uncharacterized protein YbgA (DUF1722 family)/uncharacterized protein YbbK (DUF523 family)
MSDRIKIGISTCLLGENVRYNGGHQLDRFIRDTLGAYVQFVPVCPETECGLGIPRESMRLVGTVESPRLVTSRSGVDHTDEMLAWSKARLDQLEKEDLSGFVFKKNSPSSGLYRVRVYGKKGQPNRIGRGIFARAFTERFPLIPVEEDGRLHDARLRENFIEKIFTQKRWRDACDGGRRMGVLVDFHTRQKLLILSHSQAHYRQMGRLVAEGKKKGLAKLYREYEGLLMAALNLKTTVKKNLNVLQHIMGYFKKQITADEKQELLEIFDAYRNEHVPLIVPITIINHYVRKYRQPYLAQQTYLNPHPLDLKLRNHV